jgi:ferredoxin, 2Fe-2S
LPSITYLPLGLRIACDDGDSVFGVAQRARIAITTACGAKASCGLCRVRIVSGEAHLSPLNDAEKKHLGNVYFINKLRLSCQAKVSGGDVTVEIPDASRSGQGARGA